MCNQQAKKNALDILNVRCLEADRNNEALHVSIDNEQNRSTSLQGKASHVPSLIGAVCVSCSLSQQLLTTA